MEHIILVGGGRVGSYLIQKLLRRRNEYSITIIDTNQRVLDRIEKRCKKFENITTIKGDATNKNVLKKAGIEDVDIIVAATRNDEVNLLIGIIAKDYGLKKIITRTENPSHIKMFKKLGLDEVVSPELATCINIQKQIINLNSMNLHHAGKDEYEIIELTLKSKKLIGKKIGDISPSKDFIIIQCHKYNEETERISQNDIILEKDDKITILGKSKNIKKIKKLFIKSSLLKSLKK